MASRKNRESRGNRRPSACQGDDRPRNTREGLSLSIIPRILSLNTPIVLFQRTRTAGGGTKSIDTNLERFKWLS